jgi:hypothetical protein
MPITDNLIAYWKLDETSGTRADSTLNAIDLTDPESNVGVTTGVINNAASFSFLTPNALTHITDANLETGAIDFTFSCWVQFAGDPGSDVTIFSKSGASEEEYDLSWNRAANRFRWTVCNTGYTGTSVDWSAAPPTNTWQFVMCGHRNGSNVWIRVDGGTEVTASHTAGSQVTADPFYIGRHHYNNFYNGLIDEVGFWKRDASGDYDTLYNSGAGLAYPFSGGGPSTSPTDGYIIIRQS